MNELFIQETTSDDPIKELTTNYEQLIKTKDMDLAALLSFVEEKIDEEHEINEPANEDIQNQLDILNSKAQALKEAQQVLSRVFVQLQAYENALSKRESIIQKEYSEIKILEEAINSIEITSIINM